MRHKIAKLRKVLAGGVSKFHADPTGDGRVSRLFVMRDFKEKRSVSVGFGHFECPLVRKQCSWMASLDSEMK